MNAVILSVGDELVHGQTVDSNSAWLSARLAACGVMTLYHQTVADDLDATAKAIRAAAAAAPLVILTGGLGPTDDDLTRQALARLLRRPPLDAKRFGETKRTIEEGYRVNPTPFRSIPATVQRWEEEGIIGGDPRPRRFAQVLGYGRKDLETFASRFKDRPMTFYVLGHRDRVPLDGLKALGGFEEKTLEQIFPY